MTAGPFLVAVLCYGCSVLCFPIQVYLEPPAQRWFWVLLCLCSREARFYTSMRKVGYMKTVFSVKVLLSPTGLLLMFKINRRRCAII